MAKQPETRTLRVEPTDVIARVYFDMGGNIIAGPVVDTNEAIARRQDLMVLHTGRNVYGGVGFSGAMCRNGKVYAERQHWWRLLQGLQNQLTFEWHPRLTDGEFIALMYDVIARNPVTHEYIRAEIDLVGGDLNVKVPKNVVICLTIRAIPVQADASGKAIVGGTYLPKGGLNVLFEKTFVNTQRILAKGGNYYRLSDLIKARATSGGYNDAIVANPVGGRLVFGEFTAYNAVFHHKDGYFVRPAESGMYLDGTSVRTLAYVIEQLGHTLVRKHIPVRDLQGNAYDGSLFCGNAAGVGYIQTATIDGKPWKRRMPVNSGSDYWKIRKAYWEFIHEGDPNLPMPEGTRFFATDAVFYNCLAAEF